MTDLAPFPLTGEVLAQVEHALSGAEMAEFTLHQLLDFLSGADEDRATLIGHTMGGVGIWACPDARYSEADLIRALTAEVRRLRALTGTEDGIHGVENR